MAQPKEREMKSYGIKLLACIVLLHSRAFCLDVSVTPTKDHFSDDEPIVATIRLANKSDHDVSLQLAFPQLGIQFSAIDTTSNPKRRNKWDDGGRIPLTVIPPGGNVQCLVCLNRHLNFDRIGEYEIKWKFNDQDSKSDAKYKAEGSFRLEISTGALSKTLQEIAETIESKDKTNVCRRVDPILFWNDRRVISTLVKAASLEPNSAPAIGGDIVQALEKFLELKEGRDALFVVMKVSFSGLRAGFELCSQRRIEVPIDVIKHALSVDITQFDTLKYLIDHGGPQHLKLVEPFAGDTNEHIAKLVNDFLAKFRGNELSNGDGSKK
jgi:hypothetical protein